MAEPEKWFILRRAVLVLRYDNALVDPNLDLKLAVHGPQPCITRFTAFTRIPRGQLSLVAISNKDFLLHELQRPDEPNNPNIFFLAAEFMPDERRAAAGRSAFDVIGTRLLDRDPLLPAFSSVRNVGFLSLGGGKYVVAELQANNLADNNTVPFIILSSHKKKKKKKKKKRDDGDDDDEWVWQWEWNQRLLIWPVLDGGANPHWTTHDVTAHDKKLWWVDLSRGLVACDPVPVQQLEPRLEFVALPPVLAGFQDRHEPPEQIDRYRIVGVSAGSMRFVDVARRRNHPQEETRVFIWTLDSSPPLIIDARWEDNPKQTTLGNIWNSAKYNVQMPREVPVVALVHPDEPAVVYFFLNQYVFSVDVNRSAVVHCAEMPGQQQDGVPRTLAWKRPPYKLRPLEDIYEKTNPVQQA